MPRAALKFRDPAERPGAIAPAIAAPSNRRAVSFGSMPWDATRPAKKSGEGCAGSRTEVAETDRSGRALCRGQEIPRVRRS